MWLFKLLLSIMKNESGENSFGDGGSEQGGAPEGGQGGANESQGHTGFGQTEQGGAPEGGQGGASQEPKYGPFGNEPSVDDLYAHIQDLTGNHENLKNKTSQTEQNFSNFKKQINNILQEAGLSLVTDNSNNMSIIQAANQRQQAGELQKRFTPQHAELFDNTVLEAIGLYMQDMLDQHLPAYFDKYDQTRFTSQDKVFSKVQQFNAERSNALQKMYSLWPQLKKGHEKFDQNFKQKCTEIWEKSYKSFPNGELLAATEVAAELGISPVKLMAAQKQGYKQGIQQKTIISGGQQEPKSVNFGDGRRLTKEQYLALPEKDRMEYDKKMKNLV